MVDYTRPSDVTVRTVRQLSWRLWSRNADKSKILRGRWDLRWSLYSRCINFLGYLVHASAYAVLAGVPAANGQIPEANILLAGIMQLLFPTYQRKHTVPSVTQKQTYTSQLQNRQLPACSVSGTRNVGECVWLGDKVLFRSSFPSRPPRKLNKKIPSGVMLSPLLNLRRP